jgi:hypothetical protein
MSYGDKAHLAFCGTAVALVVGLASTQPSMAQQRANLGDGPISCSDFRRGPNGSWTVLHPTTIRPEGVVMKLAAGQTFAKNQHVDGIEVTTVLDRRCGNQ